MWWRRPKAGSWTAEPLEIASKPHYDSTTSVLSQGQDSLSP